MSIYGTILSNYMTLIPANSVNPVSTPIDLTNIFPILSVAFLSLSALLFSLPVVMLFVYDKNNGVFEYLLSTGLDQLDIFKGYVKASLVTSSLSPSLFKRPQHCYRNLFGNQLRLAGKYRCSHVCYWYFRCFSRYRLYDGFQFPAENAYWG